MYGGLNADSAKVMLLTNNTTIRGYYSSNLVWHFERGKKAAARENSNRREEMKNSEI